MPTTRQRWAGGPAVAPVVPAPRLVRNRGVRYPDAPDESSRSGWQHQPRRGWGERLGSVSAQNGQAGRSAQLAPLPQVAPSELLVAQVLAGVMRLFELLPEE